MHVHRGGTHQTPLSSWEGLASPRWPSCRGRSDGRDSHALWSDPGDVMHALVTADQRLSWATHGDVLTLVQCIGLCWSVSLGHATLRLPQCPLFDTLHQYIHAWLGSLAGQAAVPVAEVHICCMASFAVFLVSSADTERVMT